jgi:hypothetical protein
MSGTRLKLVAAAAVAGFAAGGVGLAAADVLPSPVQDVAHSALHAVGVHVPPGHDRYNDPNVCPGGPYANHGAYVRAHKEDPNAGESPCGKPVQSIDRVGKPTDTDKNKNDQNEGHGPPPSAPGHGKADKRGRASSGSHPTTKPSTPSTTSIAPTTIAPTTTTSTSTTIATSTSTSDTASTTAQP